ncbi:MAG: ABC transporter ATP-binding protein [Acidimicrobiia bacterium]|nr:ABC transporter ATP-binding protein [Acidimicrobiia bacterium]
MTQANAIVARGVTRHYGDVKALIGVDLDVRHGEVFAILGPNGAGKTTFVEIMEGLRRRDGGSASVLGSDPSEASRAWRSRIGAVLQVSTQNDELTVAEMVRAFASYYPAPLDVDALLDELELTDLSNRRIHELSGGQRRRLDLALGLVGNPELLFLDEPTTGLDPEIRIRIWKLVEKLAAEGMTILLTTHYMEEAERLADRLAVLVAGEIVAEGTPGDLIGSQQSHVSFRLVAPLDAAQLPQNIADLASRDGDRIHVSTTDPTAMVTRLVAWASEHGGELAGLEIEKRGLEQVYLDLLSDTRVEEMT